MNLRNLPLHLTGRILFLMAAVLFLASTATLAQTNTAIAPNKLNVLYIGVNNPVPVAASGERITKSQLQSAVEAHNYKNRLRSLQCARN